jgi:hypothetical protein
LNDGTQVQRRVKTWYDFIGSCTVKDAERYRRLQTSLVNYMHGRRQQFSRDAAAELLVALAEIMPDVEE